MYKKRLLAGLTIATTLLAAAPVAFVGESIINAQTIVSKTTADDTTERSITIWKYEVKDASELGDRGNGVKVDKVNKKPLAGIKFSIQKVQPAEYATLVNPLKSKEGTDYTLVGTAQTAETEADGSAITNLGTGKAADGIYLVTELADDRGVEPKIAKPADPFFVTVPQTDRGGLGNLIYDVQVQPKNILESLLEPTKTIDEGADFSLIAGEKFDWQAQVNIPAGLYTEAAQGMEISPVYDKDGNEVAPKTVAQGEAIYADYLTISDTLSKNLLLDDVRLQIGTAGVADSWLDLAVADYTVTVDGLPETSSTSDTTKNVVVSLTKEGMKKIATDPALKDLTQLRAVLTTHVAKGFQVVVENTFNVDYLTPGLKPVTISSSTDPEYFTGGFDILKVADDKKTTLEGAVFQIAENETNAENQIFLASDGKSYAPDSLPAGLEFLTATSNEDGLAAFDGLALNWYDDTDSDGKQDVDELTYSQDDIKRTYWVVEVEAPTGYELLKEAKKVDVDLSTADEDVVELTVSNKSKTDLPFTGGQGTTLLVSIALGAIAVGSVTMSIDKKRRNV